MTVHITRKRSPRAPSISLDDAIDKVGKIYEKERCHLAPIHGVAQHMGYKNAANGSALSTLASLKYYGLVDRPKDGMAAVSKQYESFRFAPEEKIKREMITTWLRAPQIFSDLLDQYAEGLPSDATLKFELIGRGYAPDAAESCLQVFRKSVDFARYFELAEQGMPEEADCPAPEDQSNAATPSVSAQQVPAMQTAPAILVAPPPMSAPASDDVDRIPVRLAGGRRAWIEIPMPFYEADKERLKKQLDLLLTNDDDIDDLA